jgi:hypothetical protein
MTKAPCKFHLLQGACSSPVVCRAPLFLPCSLQGYRAAPAAAAQRACVPGATQHGRSVLQPLASLSRTWAAPMMHCRPGTLQKLRRLDRGEARLAYAECGTPGGKDRALRSPHFSGAGTTSLHRPSIISPLHPGCSSAAGARAKYPAPSRSLPNPLTSSARSPGCSGRAPCGRPLSLRSLKVLRLQRWS